MERLRVGISHGDINGISYELIIKLMADNKICELCTPVLFGSAKIAAYYRKNLFVENFSLNSIQKPQDANPKRCNLLTCVDDDIKVEPGKETPESDESAMLSLRSAINALDSNKIDVLVALPQGIASFALENASGSVDYLSKYYDTKRIMPILVGEKMKMGFVTLHTSFKDITKYLTVNNIFEKLKLMNYSLQRDFSIRKPKIAVLALNPHAGDSLTFGEEENNSIIPAIEQARAWGIMALGPYVADSLFVSGDYSKFDAILAMYHDQGMIPFKTIEGFGGATLMAGVPDVCTTTVHGMAFDIADQNKGDESALRNALYLGIDVFRNRVLNDELRSNPLRHYDISSNSNESDLNVEEIAGVNIEE